MSNYSSEELKCYKLVNMPPPALQGMSRIQVPLAFWPYGFMHKETCDKSGESMVTIFTKEKFPIYKREHWYDDTWERPSMEIDWNRPFLDQMLELQTKTPHFHVLGYKNENCDYNEDIWFSKNCYMCRHVGYGEDLLYCYRMVTNRACTDCTYCLKTEQCYSCVYCIESTALYYSLYSNNCSYSYFLYDCRNCHDCVLCWNMRNKQYCIENVQYTKERYEEKVAEMNLQSRSSLLKLHATFLEKIKRDAIHRVDRNLRTEDSLGNHLVDCKNVRYGYFWEDGEDCAYAFRGAENKDVFNSCGMFKCELTHFASQCTETYQVSHALYSANTKFSNFIDQCVDCKNLLGCVGLYKKQYCILNKQYSKEEYEELKPRVLKKLEEEGALNSFFPIKFAYSTYNQSLAALFFRETEESAKEKGFIWGGIESKKTSKGIPGDSLPDSAKEVTTDFLGKEYACSVTQHPYNFIDQEIRFYKEMKLPLPEHYPEFRQLKRYQLVPPVDMRSTSCNKCGTTIDTYYPEHWHYANIYCESCYEKAVY